MESIATVGLILGVALIAYRAGGWRANRAWGRKVTGLRIRESRN
jgi:hypothetical protein